MTTSELAARHGVSVAVMRGVLRDEERRGHVERIGEDAWRAGPAALTEFGQTFRDLTRGLVPVDEEPPGG